MDNIQRANKIRGCMIGGAIGDALGYPVEFMTYQQIVDKYGDKGIIRYELNKNGVAEISDDTQMTLFTANGLLFGHTRGALHGIMGSVDSYIRDAYLEWLQTQTGDIDYTKWHYSWIREVKELHSCRAPGTTCIQALQHLADHKEVTNNSKGCGGVIRIAPIPLFYSVYDQLGVKEAGDAAAITHKHPLGYLPAALLSYLISRLIKTEHPTSYQIAMMVVEGVRELRKLYPNNHKDIDNLQHICEKAARRSISALNDEEAIRQIGEGWVAEETLAIALLCTMRYPDNFEKAITASVNHSGDSDSTGAVTGNIMGAIHGYDAIPTYFKEDLELRWLIEEMADDIAGGIPVGEYADKYDTSEKRRWMDRYVEGIFKDVVPIKNSYLLDRNLNLYAGEYPGAKDKEECRMKVQDPLAWDKFCHFYDLTETGELTPYACYLKEQQHYHRFPIPDCGIPSSTVSVRRLIEEIIYNATHKDSYYGNKGKTYIHCWGGVGRTGTIVACLYAYLLKDKGLTKEEIYQQAMQHLYDSFSRCPKSKYRKIPDTQEQEEFIKAFAFNEC